MSERGRIPLLLRRPVEQAADDSKSEGDGFDLERIKVILDKRERNGTGGELAESILEDLSFRLEEVASQIERCQRLQVKLRRAIDSLCRCRPCELRLEERLCPECDVLDDEPKEPFPFFHAMPQN